MASGSRHSRHSAAGAPWCRCRARQTARRARRRAWCCSRSLWCGKSRSRASSCQGRGGGSGLEAVVWQRQSRCEEAGVDTRRMHAAARQDPSGRVAKNGAATANSMQQQCAAWQAAAAASQAGAVKGRCVLAEVVAAAGVGVGRVLAAKLVVLHALHNVWGRRAQPLRAACTPICSSNRSLLALRYTCERSSSPLHAPRDFWCSTRKKTGHANGHLGRTATQVPKASVALSLWQIRGADAPAGKQQSSFTSQPYMDLEMHCTAEGRGWAGGGVTRAYLRRQLGGCLLGWRAGGAGPDVHLTAAPCRSTAALPPQPSSAIGQAAHRSAAACGVV